MKNIPVPFSKNELNYLIACQSSWFNEAEGGKRAGKNVINVIAFCRELETHPDRLFLVGGFTQGTAAINVLDCDGFGVYNYFHGRYRDGKYEGKKAVRVRTKTGEKIILVVGMGKKGSEADFKGYTIGMAYLTEINEMAESAVKEAFDRTMTSKRRKIFCDLNPKAPNHWFYKNVEATHKKKNEERKKEIKEAIEKGKTIPKPYGFNYGHFTIADNMSVSDENVREVLNTYDKDSLYFKRDILGIRCALNGLCFPLLAERMKNFVISKDDPRLKDIIYIRNGTDFGGSTSFHSFVSTAFTKHLRHVIVLRSERVNPSGMTPEELDDRYCDHIEGISTKYNKSIESRCDSAEQALINGLRKASASRRLRNDVLNAKKIVVNDRIQLINRLAAQGRLLFVEGETDSIQDALCNAVWNEKEAEKGNDVRLDNNTSDIDSCDSFEYSLEPDFDALINLNYTKGEEQDGHSRCN